MKRDPKAVKSHKQSFREMYGGYCVQKPFRAPPRHLRSKRNCLTQQLLLALIAAYSRLASDPSPLSTTSESRRNSSTMTEPLTAITSALGALQLVEAQQNSKQTQPIAAQSQSQLLSLPGGKSVSLK